MKGFYGKAALVPGLCTAFDTCSTKSMEGLEDFIMLMMLIVDRGVQKS